MALHLLYASQRLSSCVAACREDDAILIMSSSFDVAANQALLNQISCPLFQLKGHADVTAAGDVASSQLKRINDAEWVELTTQHQQIIAWHGQ